MTWAFYVTRTNTLIQNGFKIYIFNLIIDISDEIFCEGYIVDGNKFGRTSPLNLDFSPL